MTCHVSGFSKRVTLPTVGLSTCVLGVLLAFSSGAGAQSLSGMLEAARQFDATYLSDTAAARATYAAAKLDNASTLPKVSLVSSVTQSNVYVSGETTDTLSRYIGVSASHSLYNENYAAEAKKVPLGEQTAATLQSVANQSLIIRVAQAYFDTLTAQDTLVSVQASKKAASQQLAAANRNFEVGNTTITDSREAQAQFDLITAEEITAANNLELAKLALSQLTGVKSPQPKAFIADQLPNLSAQSLDTWILRASEVNLAVASARVDLENARLDLEIAKAGGKPTLDLTMSYLQNGTSSAHTSANTSSYKPTTSVALAFNWPLYTGGAVENAIAAALEKENKASADLENATRTATNQVKRAFLGLQSGMSQATALQAALVSSQSALEANQLGYEVGVRINIDVLNAQTAVYKTQASLAKARHDVLLGSLKLRQAVGVLSDADVDAVSRLLQP